MPGFAECGPDKTAEDCIACAGVLSYYARGVKGNPCSLGYCRLEYGWGLVVLCHRAVSIFRVFLPAIRECSAVRVLHGVCLVLLVKLLQAYTVR